MDRRTAAEVVPMLVRAAQEISDTVHVYSRHATESEVRPYSDTTGNVVLSIYDILRKIVAEHPDLDPGGFS